MALSPPPAQVLLCWGLLPRGCSVTTGQRHSRRVSAWVAIQLCRGCCQACLPGVCGWGSATGAEVSRISHVSCSSCSYRSWRAHHPLSSCVLLPRDDVTLRSTHTAWSAALLLLPAAAISAALLLLWGPGLVQNLMSSYAP